MDENMQNTMTADFMRQMREEMVRQFRNEMAQQIREEIRREMRAEQQHEAPTQQFHSETNQDVSCIQTIIINQLDLVYREQERIRRLAKAKFGGRKAIMLDGRENYIKWRDSMLMDAYMIEAKDVLDQTESPYSDEIETAR
jgi:hypothetical protein